MRKLVLVLLGLLAIMATATIAFSELPAWVTRTDSSKQATVVYSLANGILTMQASWCGNKNIVTNGQTMLYEVTIEGEPDNAKHVPFCGFYETYPTLEATVEAMYAVHSNLLVAGATMIEAGMQPE